MADRKHLLHVKSNVAQKAKQYGINDFLVTPKKPVDSTTGKASNDTLLYGEIAVNYGKGVEALTIRNTEDNVVAFVNENDFYEAGEIAADGLATEKSAREEADATEKSAREEAEFVAADAFNYLDNKIGTLEAKMLEAKMVSTTYAEIKVLREQSKLKPGQFYRITDYVTTTTQENTQSAGHVFDVIVLATDVDTLNENAKVIKHEGDTYFANSDLDAWEIKYDLDNDTTKYAWADETNGKGVIFYMKDEWNNECPYDFKNIKFKRWAVTDVQSSKLDSATLNLLKGIFGYDDDNAKFMTRYAYVGSNYVFGDTTHVVNAYDNEWYYTFSTIKFEDGIYALNNIEDASIKGNNFYNDEGGGGCFGNSIKPYYNNVASEKGGIDGAQYLNNIVFNGYYQTDERWLAYHCFGNSIGYNSFENTFGFSCNHNSFGEGFCRNSFGNYCRYNSFGNSCWNNSFNECSSNTFGDECESNTFVGCNDNSFGNSCTYNSFGVGCSHNSFGDYCSYNSFGVYCSYNSFGNYCSYNSFGVYCSYNSFGNNVQYVRFEKDYMYDNVVENGNTYITVTSSQTTSSSLILRNFTIAQGVNNATSENDRKTISHNTTNDTFKTTYQNANSQTVDV